MQEEFHGLSRRINSLSMVRVKLDQETVGLSLVLENISGARVKDCFQDEDTIYFIVAPGEIGKAIGKGGMNIRRVQNELQKKIKVVEFRERLEEFVRNVIYPVSVQEIVEEGSVIILKSSSSKTKGLLIGRGGKNLKFINRAVQRFFGKEVRVE